MDSCNDCKFAKKPPLVMANTHLVCRRNPPATLIIGQQMVGVFPSVTPKDWCGEFVLVPHVGLNARAITVEQVANKLLDGAPFMDPTHDEPLG